MASKKSDGMTKLMQEAEKLGIPVSCAQAELLDRFQALLLAQNESVNLTRITDPDEVRIKHFLDSLSLLRFLPESRTGAIIDVGTGAGFPGIPLAVMRPDIPVTLLDSLRKRIVFLRNVADTLGLSNVTLVHSRAEDAAHDDRYRERFDVAVSRAVASLPVLAELCLPFVVPGGAFCAMKGPDPKHELDEALPAIAMLGGVASEPEEVALAGMTHSIIIVSKITHTPTMYPRKPAKIKKSPIIG